VRQAQAQATKAMQTDAALIEANPKLSLNNPLNNAPKTPGMP
jgi:hypothetical protein